MWVMLIMFVISLIAGELLRPKPKFDTPTASSLGDFQLPTAEEGRAIPVVFGTCKIKGSNVVWYGDLEVRPMTKDIKTGLFSSETITTGYQYFLGIQAALCHGVVDQIIQIQFDDKVPLQSVSSITNGTRVNIEDDYFLGGPDQSGGIGGLVDIYFGNSAQAPDAYLEQAVAGPAQYVNTGTGWHLVTPTPVLLPAYRGICYAVFRHFWFGNSSYIKPFSVVLKSVPNPLALSSGRHDINGDANPANMIYAILTDTTWGLCIPSGQIDTAAFVAVGNTLAAEGMGLSILMDSQNPAGDYINEISRHIDGVVYSDPSTGLVTISLARGDYDFSLLPVLNTSNIKTLQLNRSSWAETINTIKVTYTDRAQNYTERVVQAQDLANVQGRGGELSSQTMAFAGFSNADAATLAAARNLKTLSYPLARFTISVNRAAWKLFPAGVFRLDWPPLGISGMACRVIRVQYGTLDQGDIQIEATEDIWGTVNTAYASPGGTDWVDPIPDIANLEFKRLMEVPWHLLLSNDRKVMTLGVRQNPTIHGYNVFTDKAGGTNYIQTNTVNTFNPGLSLVSALPRKASVYDTGGLIVAAGPDSNLIATCSDDEFTDGVNTILIDDEIIAFKTVTDNGDGTFTLAPLMRGVMDTVPADHVIHTMAVHFLGSGLVQPQIFAADVTLSCKFVPFNGRDVFPIGSVSPVSLVLDSRAASPYPPGNVLVNAIYYPDAVYNDAVMTWNHRYRLNQPKLARQDDADVSGGPEGTYTIAVYIGGVLARTATGITGKTYTYTSIQRAGDDSDGGKITSLVITPINGAYTGTPREEDFAMTGFGMCFGMYFGGIQG